MSLLLNSLKKADQEEKASANQPAQPAQSTQPVKLKTSATAAEPVSVDIDLDSVEAGQDDSSAQQAAPQQKELVSASRVFRAGGEEENTGTGSGFRRLLLGVLLLVVIFGGGYGVVSTGIIPGVTIESMKTTLGLQDVQPVIQQQRSEPQLAAISSEDAALSLPSPLIDVQSDIVDFAGLQGQQSAGSGLLNTPEGRREFVAKVAILTQYEEEQIFGEEIVAQDSNILSDEIDLGSTLDEEDNNLEEIVEIKTAAYSRDVKRELDSQTISEHLFSDIKINAVAQAEEPTTSQPNDSDVSLSQAEEEITVSPSLSGKDRQRLLSEARQFYNSGAHAQSEEIYRRILSKNATNVNALRGLALVAVATGRYQLAASTYLRILEFYPNDPVAIADLTNLHGISGESFYTVEGAIKNALGEYPELDSRLHFALGNLYAGVERWVDAQRSYFDAYSMEQSNPDYAYNLAVVLDYLNKPRLAVNYYQIALDLSATYPSGFSDDQVKSRINSILN